MLLDLCPADEMQPTLWHPGDSEKTKKLHQVLDQLNGYYGDDTIQLGSCGIKKSWKMRRDFTSNRYTTQLDELMVAHAR